MTSHFIYGPYTREASATDRRRCGSRRLSSVSGAVAGTVKLRTLVRRQGGNEGCYGNAGNGVTPLGIDIGQGEQDECTLVQSRVRQNRTAGFVTDAIIIGDQVEIEGAGLVPDGTRPAELRLHLMKQPE
jgi:hypothetical protein